MTLTGKKLRQITEDSQKHVAHSWLSAHKDLIEQLCVESASQGYSEIKKTFDTWVPDYMLGIVLSENFPGCTVAVCRLPDGHKEVTIAWVEP